MCVASPPTHPPAGWRPGPVRARPQGDGVPAAGVPRAVRQVPRAAAQRWVLRPGLRWSGCARCCVSGLLYPPGACCMACAESQHMCVLLLQVPSCYCLQVPDAMLCMHRLSHCPPGPAVQASTSCLTCHIAHLQACCSTALLALARPWWPVHWQHTHQGQAARCPSLCARWAAGGCSGLGSMLII
jgi:hypothetical protein